MKNIKILDCTLREGEQFKGVCFSTKEKIIIAEKLKKFGVDIIEIGHPGISESEQQSCTDIIKNIKGAEVLVHARATKEDIEAASETGADWVGIWASYNDISLKTKFNNKSRTWIKNRVSESITLARKLGLKVRFSIEDASRTSLEDVYDITSEALKSGANRISLADTVGTWHPKECYDVVKSIKSKFNCELEVHLHNDLGLAHANAISAIDAGVTVIDTSILGVGERAGICDLISIAKTLDKFYLSRKFDFRLSMELSEIVARIGCFNIEPHHPLVGPNAFTHTSKYHVKAVKKEPSAYETVEPVEFDRERSIVVNELDRADVQRVSKNLEVKQPFIKGASELLHHRDGVGSRWVFMDNRIDSRSQIYIIERIFDKDYSSLYKPHVDSHAHNCDSNFVFMGNNHDGTGLKVSVTFGKDDEQKTKIIDSPASVYIPKDIYHSYSYISGTGRFLNFVLSPNYNKSIVNQ